MRSIWIAIGRDDAFGHTNTTEDVYVFESSFDAYKFIAGIKHYKDIPERIRNQDWSVDEYPINPNKMEAIIDFYRTHKEDSHDRQDAIE
jgi:hypothetical protein